MNKHLARLDLGFRAADAAFASWISPLVADPPALDSFLFHPVFKNSDEISNDNISPFEKFTLLNFRELIEYYLEEEYRFVSPGDLKQGLKPRGKYVSLTFDDGYANNLRIVPLLNEYSIPATFFIATNHILQNKAFWWDVVTRYRGQQGIPRLKTLRERNYLKSLRHYEIDEHLQLEFGADCSKPASELERPMTPAELSEFANEKWVHLGNHTHDHAILTNYDYQEVISQINQCQMALKDMTGITATAISYPDGAYSDSVISAAQEAGLEVGITTIPARNTPPPTQPEPLMEISRISLSGDFNVQHQCKALRTTFSPLRKLRSFALAGYQALQPKPLQS